MAAAVVSRSVVLCSRPGPSECHGGYHVQHLSKHLMRNLWLDVSASSSWVMCCPVGRSSSSSSSSSSCRTESRRQFNLGKGNPARLGTGSGCSSSQLRAATGSGSVGVTPEVAGVEEGIKAGPKSSEEGGENAQTGLRIGQRVIKGLREEMEDDVELQEGPLGFTYIAVFDGHAGFGATEFVRRELYQDLVNSLDGGKLLESDNQTALEEAFAKAFQQTDDRLLSWLDTLEPESLDKDSGATASVVFIREGSVTVANVGDSRTVMSQNGKAIDLSADHRPYGNNKIANAEVNRIKQAGGWVQNGRVGGCLSVSRAFGDLPLKLRKKEMLEQGIKERRWTRAFADRYNTDGVWLSVKPDVKHVQLGEDVEFVIVASDGLWDSFKSKDAVKFVTRQLQKHGDVQKAAEAIVQATLERHGQDNISVVILDLGRIPLGEPGLNIFDWF